MAGAELSDVIAKLRDDLSVALAEGEGERLRFELGPIEVTLRVDVTSGGGGKVGIKFWVVEAGVDGTVSKATGQEIKLTLNPKDTLATTEENKSYPSPIVSGEAAPGEAS